MDERAPSVALSTKIAAAVLTTIVVMWLRWDFSLRHFDFQVWRAADALASTGADPYDADALNAELRLRPETYGDHWIGEGAENRRMYFFNPPVWLAQLRLFGYSALAMTLAGFAATMGSIVALARSHPLLNTIGYLAGAGYLLIFSPGVSTLRFGQVGLLVAGLVGLRLLLIDRRAEGVPIAALAFKPHLALALGLTSLTRRPVRTAARVGVPLVGLVAVAALLYPLGIWTSWFEALRGGDPREGFDDMSLRTLSTRWPLPEELSLVTIALAIVISVTMARRYDRADVRVLTLATLALMALLSGHAYAHDWLWLVFVPVLRQWSLAKSMVIGLLFGVLHTVGTAISDAVEHQLISIRTVLALAAAAYLVYAVRDSHIGTSAGELRSTPTEPEDTVVATTVGGEHAGRGVRS